MKLTPDFLLKVIKKYGLMLGLVAALVIGLLTKPDFVLSLLEKDKGFYFLGFLLILFVLFFYMGKGEHKLVEQSNDKDTVRELLKDSFDSFIKNNIAAQQRLNEILKEILSITDDLNDNIQLVKDRLIAIDKSIYDLSNRLQGNIPISLLKVIISDISLLLSYEIIRDICQLKTILDLDNYVTTFQFKFTDNFINSVKLKYLVNVDKDTQTYILALLNNYEQKVLELLTNTLKELKQKYKNLSTELPIETKSLLRNDIIQILFKTISKPLSSNLNMGGGIHEKG